MKEKIKKMLPNFLLEKYYKIKFFYEYLFFRINLCINIIKKKRYS